MPEHFYGWIKDKYNLKAIYHEPIVKVLPPSTNNRIYFPTVRNQGQVGICGGFSWAELLESVCKQIGQPVDRFSENWIYNGARYLEGTLQQDAGMANDDAVRWLSDRGFLLYPYWPFSGALDKSAPSSLRQSEANKYPNLQSFRVDNGIDGLKSAMADGHLMVVGAPWFEEWEHYSGGVLPVPTMNSVIAGGHDTEWGDYDDAMGGFYCQNSWGNWGIQGHFWVPYQAINIFKNMGGYDAHYVTFDPLNPAPPQPAPAHKCCISTLLNKARAERRQGYAY
jgi:Papain family cysteine protease